ncbi:hypothetical protein [Kitasatospora sp. NPDC057015]|uniref:hypothetical protein n=1 Tax=Kitasatospora sp. NPDC057015 TaxID=3346001 RepID=UPI00362A990B
MKACPDHRRPADGRAAPLRGPAARGVRPVAGRRTTRPLVAAAAVAGALLAVLATGCGIRPTAVPVDAGRPASRTACPSPVQVPTAAATPTADPSAQRAPAATSPTPRPSSSARAAAGNGASPSAARTPAAAPTAVAPGPAVTSVPADGVFSALPSPSTGGTGQPGCP